MAKGHTALKACVVAIVGVLLGAAQGPVQAQVTPAQRDAVRANCRGDFLSLCRGVTPGGAEALNCLKSNAAKLAAACKQAVDAIPSQGSDLRESRPERSTTGAAPSAEPPVAEPAPATAPEPRMVVAQLGPRQLRNLQIACGGDAQIFCVGVPRNPQARIACLRENAANLSPGCQQELRALAAAMPGGTPAAAAAPAAGAPAGQPSAEQQAAIRASCRSDAMSLCRGQQGQAALACLSQNSARLSPACRQAVAAVAGPPSPAAPAATAPARATPPAGVVAQAPPSAEQQSAIRANCRSDAMSLCPGQQGQQALACLKTNSARLSPACRTAVGAIGGAPAAPAAAAPPPPAPRPPAPAAAAAPAPAAPAAAPAQPTQAQQDAIRANCRGDAMSLCPGQQGQQAFTCLKTNSARLSPACRTAVSAIGAPAPAPAPAAAAPAPAPAPAAPAAAPAAAAAPQSEAESMALLGRSCGGDIQTHCKGVSLGGGRLMACLAANGAALSPGCKQALTDVSRAR